MMQMVEGLEVTPKDVLEAASTTHRALVPFVGRDWSVQAGDLDWDVRKTVAHVSDALGWYAAHLALQTPRRLRFDFRRTVTRPMRNCSTPWMLRRQYSPA
jgi:hypothetical protein